MSTKLLRSLAASMPDPAASSRWIALMPEVSSYQRVYVEAASPSFPKIAAQARVGGGRQHYYPGLLDQDGISLILYETHMFSAQRYMNAWMDLVFNRQTGTYGLPGDYRKNITFQFFPRNSDSPALTMEYIGAWPTDQQPYELSYDQIDGRLILSAQFAVQRVEFTQR